jgi:5-deoxy-D-glucuronate isomerase
MVLTQVKTDPLSHADRIIIASVITQDNLYSYCYLPSEVVTIRLEHDMVSVKLTNNRAYPISRFMFRGILESQRTAIIKMESEMSESEILPNGYHDPHWTSEGCEF